MRIAVIGAGPAGLTAAYELTKAGYEVEVYEASGDVGGMAKSIELWGQTVDIGPHRFFSKDAKVNKLWLEVADQDYVMVDRLTRIYYKGQFFQYPLKPFEALWKLGPIEAVLSLGSYFLEKLKGHDSEKADNFEDWVVQKFGNRLYQHFFKSYSEKLWGISCRELDKEFAVQRIKNLDLWEAVKNAFSDGGTKHKTLVDRFAYPIYGTGMVYERMAEYIKREGNQIHLNTPIKGVLRAPNNYRITGLEHQSGQQVEYDAVISSMPITALVKHMPQVPETVLSASKQLKFRNTILVYLWIDTPNLFPDNALYIHAEDLKVGRITNFRNWSSYLHRSDDYTSILVLEHWCFFEDEFWQKGEEELITLAKEEIRKTGLVQNANILDGFTYRIPRCYPVYDKGYKTNLSVIREYLKKFHGLQAIGRYGSFNYTNQDHSILMGMLAAENLIKGKNHDLWEINSEAQYQEDSVIGEHGLVTS